MKISFDPYKATLDELCWVQAIVGELVDKRFSKTNDFKEREHRGSSDEFTGAPVHSNNDSDSDDDIVELPEQPMVVPTKDGLALVVSPETAPAALAVPPAPPPATVSPPPAPNTQEPAAVSTGTAQSVTPPFAGISKTPIYNPENPSEGFNAELDSDGIAWDPTIHSETRMKNANGTWRKRRTTKNVEVKQSIPGLEHLTPNSVPAPPSRKMVNTFVRIDGAQELIKAPDGATDEELSAITGQPTMREDRYQAAQAAPTTPVGVTIVPPPPPAAPVAPAVVKTAPQGAPAGTFAELMERVTKYFGSQSITTQDLIEVCATFSIKSVQECYAQPALIPLVSNAIDEKVKARMGAA